MKPERGVACCVTRMLQQKRMDAAIQIKEGDDTADAEHVADRATTAAFMIYERHADGSDNADDIKRRMAKMLTMPHEMAFNSSRWLLHSSSADAHHRAGRQQEPWQRTEGRIRAETWLELMMLKHDDIVSNQERLGSSPSGSW